MANRTHLDKAATPEAHVPWESIDEEVEESDLEEESSAGDSPKGEVSEGASREHLEEVAVAFGAVEADDPGQPSSRPPSTGGGWTVPILCAGVALIACCALIPQADSNRRLTYERQELQR